MRGLGFFLGALVGCGGESGPPPPDADGDSDADADTDADSDGDTDSASDTATDVPCDRVWEFRSGPDSIGAGDQDYRCYTNPVPEGMGGRAVRITMAVSEDDVPIVHHLVLMRGNGPGFGGCKPAEFFNPIVFAGGPGTDPLVLPPGVGLPAEDGMGFVMQLHVTNATDDPIDFDVGADVCLVDATENDADVVTFGPVALEIPDDGVEHSFTDDQCTVTGERTFFAAYPHMHQLGTHIELALDDDVWAAVPAWNFSDQPTVYPDPVRVATEGQRLRATCTYVNPAGNGTVSFGTRTEDEMCFGFAYYWPAGLERWCADIPFGF